MPPPVKQTESILAWEGYWRHTDEAAAHRAGGRHEPLLAGFWSGIFQELLAARHSLRALDVACGNGAALGYLFGVAGNIAPGPEIIATGLDGSVAALKDLQRRLPQVCAVVADARYPPFRDRDFELVVSQFGVEYGGVDAVLGTERMVAPGGTLALIMHLRDGGIYRECLQNLRAIDAVMAMLPLARVAIDAGIAAGQGRGSREAFRAADRAFAPSVKVVEGVFRECGREVAGGFALRLYRDIGHIYRNPAAFAADEVAAWLGRMDVEVATYRRRMEGMLNAALDERQYNELVAHMSRAGMVLRTQDKLGLGEAGQAAWILVAMRPQS